MHVAAAPREEKEDCGGLQQVLQLCPGLCWLHPKSKRGQPAPGAVVIIMQAFLFLLTALLIFFCVFFFFL